MGPSPLLPSEALRLLVADRRGWVARTLHTVLDAPEWAVTHVRGAAGVLEQLPRARPHIVLVNDDAEDIDVPSLCAELRRDPIIGVLTPIVVVSTQPLRERRLAALRAGATDYSVFPADSEPFLLELRALAVARREAERLERAVLLDASTGLYTVSGLVHRAREIANEASRRHDPVTCLALVATPRVQRPDASSSAGRPVPVAPGDVPVARSTELDDAIARARRRSDAVGRRDDVLVVLAPATGGPGAQRMAERLRAALEPVRDAEVAPSEGPRVRAAYCTVADFARTTVDIESMIDRAIALLMTTHGVPSEAAPVIGESIPLGAEA